MADLTASTPYPADDYHLKGYQNLLDAERAGTLQPGQADALARGRQGGMFALLDQAMQAQDAAPPATPPGDTSFLNAPQASMTNPTQGAADEMSFNPPAQMPSSATYRPYDVGLADRLGLVPLVQRDPVTGRTPTGANAPDLTGQGHLGGYVGGEFPDRLIASIQQLPRALQEHPLQTAARIIGHLQTAPGDVPASAIEESQGSTAASLARLPVDAAALYANPLGRYATGGVLNQLMRGGRALRGLNRLIDLLGQTPDPTRRMPPPPGVNQGPVPPSGPQSPYYVPPGSTFH